jgi:PmbA protein
VTELPDVVAGVLEHASGDEQLEAYAVHRIETTIQAGTDATVRQITRAETRGVGVRVIRDCRLGYASTSDLEPDAIRLTVQRARTNALAGDRDDAQGLPEPAERPPADGLWSPALSLSTLAEKTALVVDLARRVVSLDPRVRALDTAEYHEERRTVAVASTRGVRTVHETGYVELWSDALGEDPSGPASDYAYRFSRSPGELDVESVAAEAVARTVRMLGPPVSHHAGAPVVLDPAVVADLLTAVGKGLSGGPVSSGRTPFAGRKGEQVAAACVRLVDDGLSPSVLAAGTYDDEGVPRRRTPLVEDGVLVGSMHSTVTARATEAPSGSTGNARRTTHKAVPRAAATGLVLGPTTHLDDALSGLDEAVYVQQLSGSGSGINPVTGRVDVGGVGWLLRRGAPAGRLDTVPISTSLPAMLRSVIAVGDDAAQVPFTPAVASTVVCDGGLVDGSR